MQIIIITTLVIAVIGIVVGAGLVFTGKKFHVDVDEKELAVRAELPGCFQEKGVAQLTRRLLEAEALFGGPGGRVPVPENEGNALPAAPGFHKAQIAQGFLPADAMLEVGGGHVQPCCK